MASLAMHLAVASKYLEKHSSENATDIIIGAYLPDIDCDKIISHYGRKTPYTTAKNFLYDKVDIIKCVLDLDFGVALDRGKFLHLFTDYIFYRFIYDEKIEETFQDGVNNLIYKDFDYTTNYILSKYTIPVPDKVKHIVYFREGDLKPILTTDSMIDACISVFSDIDINECKLRVLSDLDNLTIDILNKLNNYVRSNNMAKSKVYFTKDISSEGLLKIYDAMGVSLKSQVAVKISTGEPGGHNFLNPKLIEPLVSKLSGTIVECCTAYKGRRFTPQEHWKVMKEHGFMDIAPCDILDEDGDIKLKVTGGTHLHGYNLVGKNIEKYDSMLILSHFKGHQMGGFGGALKNMSIGLASREGKAWIHSWGNSTDLNSFWSYTDNQDAFLESMAEACESVVSHFGESNMAYINVANRLSIDCDCNSHPKEPEMADIGIFASVDPVALDQACYDAIINSTDMGKQSLIDRMKERNAIHIVDEAINLKIGTKEYTIIDID